MLIGDPAQRYTAMEKVCLHRFPIKGGRRGARRRITAGRTGMRHGHLFLEVGSMVFGRAVGQIKTTPQKPTTPPHFWKRRSKRDQRYGTWRERPLQGAMRLAQLSHCRENLPKQRHAVKDFFPNFSARERFLTLRRLQHPNTSKALSPVPWRRFGCRGGSACSSRTPAWCRTAWRGAARSRKRLTA